MKILLLPVAFLFCASGSSAQPPLQEIVPLSSNRTEVEKQLGSGKLDDFGKWIYSKPGYLFAVSYYDGSCKSDEGLENLSKDTVVHVTIRLIELTPVGDLIRDEKSYERYEVPGLAREFAYYDPTYGIMIMSQYPKVSDPASSIYIFPKKTQIRNCLFVTGDSAFAVLSKLQIKLPD